MLLDPEHWRDRADEARAQARQMTDPCAKKAVMAIVESCEQIAAQQEKLLFGGVAKREG